MAKQKEELPVISRRKYFQDLYRANPDWLKESDNRSIVAQWEKDHPGDVLVSKIRSSISSAKSDIRKELGLKRPRRGGRRKKLETVPETINGQTEAPKTVAPRVIPSGANLLLTLETMLDDALVRVAQQKDEDLDPVYRALKMARNAVVWRLGPPPGL